MSSHRLVLAPTAAPVAAESPRRWFGWQIALVDLGSIALIAGGGALTSNSSGFAILPILGGAAYFGGGPLVHVLHHDSDGAWRSLLLRTAVPAGSAVLFAGLAALTATRGNSDLCYPRDFRTCAAVFGGIAGFGVGMVGAMVTDWIISSGPEPSTGEEPRLSASIIPRPGGASIGVAGRF